MNKKHIPFTFINLIADKSSKYFKWPMNQLHRVLSKSDRLFVQDSITKQIYAQLGIQPEKIVIVKDTRGSSIHQDVNALAYTTPFDNVNSKLIVYGSVYPNEIALINNSTTHFTDYHHIVVPHDIHQKNIDIFLSKLDKTFKLYSDTISNISQYTIVNTIGDLKKIYKAVDLCYIGGGFGNGIHNSLEAMIHHVPVIGGPNHRGFKEIDFFEDMLYYTIKSQENFVTTAERAILQNLSDSEKEKIDQFFSNNESCNTILKYISKTLEKHGA